MTEPQALSVVGCGLVAWLHDHGPATEELLEHHFAADGSCDHWILGDELRHLESIGRVRQVVYFDAPDSIVGSSQRATLWAVVPQPATTIHIQRPTEDPL